MKLYTIPLVPDSKLMESRTYKASPSPLDNQPTISMEISLGCIKRCVGESSATRCAYCGDDQACWDSCAGGSAGTCVSNCL